MIEHKVGEIVGIKDKKYIALVYNCQGCDLRGTAINCTEYLACRKDERSDGVSIVYKKLEGNNEK